MSACAIISAGNGAEGSGFDRIIPGWTNYSTAFSVTHDAASDGEFATAASWYTPPLKGRPLEYSVIVIWFGTGGQRLNFDDFIYQVHCWSSLEALIQDPRHGDLAVMSFPAPTGGSTMVPDATTRGGRAAYLLSFDLSAMTLAFEQCRTCLIGFVAQAKSPQAGELYVPTAPFDGLSDVQAGNIVPFGWQHLVDAGGQTIYAGQLATRLRVQLSGEPPRLSIERQLNDLCLEWPESAGCYQLESRVNAALGSSWMPVMELPAMQNGNWRLCLPAAEALALFRLKAIGSSTRIGP